VKVDEAFAQKYKNKDMMNLYESKVNMDNNLKINNFINTQPYRF